MIRRHREAILVLSTFLAGASVSYLVLNRWLLTDLGLQSYGRVWQLYVSYIDFGFVRRAFVGTVLSETGAHLILKNEYYFALAIHHLSIATLATIAALFCLKKRVTDPIFVAGIAFSPAFIIHSGYNTGSLDVFVTILAALNILVVRHVAMFSVIAAAGVLTHEIFLFTVPAQICALLYARRSTSGESRLGILLAPVLVIVVAAVSVTVFGTSDLSLGAFEDLMRQRLPNAEGNHVLWSGYREIASSVEQDGSGSLKRLTEIRGGIAYLLLPLAYVALLIARLRTYSSVSTDRPYLAIAVVAPLFTAVVATDYHRWIAMSANMGILLSLVLAGESARTESRWNVPLLLFCLLAPFGGAEIERPFPMHQFIIERFLH